MGQITNPIVKGITVNPIDRQSGPAAGAGASGNNVVLLGAGAGTNEAISNAIFIGNGAGSGGLVDTANLNGSTIVGVGSATAVTAGDGTGIPLTLLGSNSLAGYPAAVGSTVVIGSKILNSPAAGQQGVSQSVFVGNNIFANAKNTSFTNANCVVIGDSITAVAAGNSAQIATSVVIGCQIATGQAGQNNSITNSVLIGEGTVSGGSSISNTVAIGGSQTLSGVLAGGAITLLGFGISFSGAAVGGENQNVIVGNGIIYSGNNNTVIGSAASLPVLNGNTSGGNVLIGCRVGVDFPGAASPNNLLAVGASLSSGQPTPAYLLYGSFATGNLILGNSINAVNRDFGGVPGTNILKLLNGTRSTGAAIIGGGYFYVVGGVLHWVDSNGVDSQLSETAQGQIASSALAAFTNNAAAAAGTLLNAPVAGNPTKWIPINDAGTIRNIPAW